MKETRQHLLDGPSSCRQLSSYTKGSSFQVRKRSNLNCLHRPFQMDTDFDRKEENSFLTVWRKKANSENFKLYIQVELAMAGKKLHSNVWVMMTQCPPSAPSPSIQNFLWLSCWWIATELLMYNLDNLSC
jgi:hypothetical protein